MPGSFLLLTQIVSYMDTRCQEERPLSVLSGRGLAAGVQGASLATGYRCPVLDHLFQGKLLHEPGPEARSLAFLPAAGHGKNFTGIDCAIGEPCGQRRCGLLRDLPLGRICI